MTITGTPVVLENRMSTPNQRQTEMKHGQLITPRYTQKWIPDSDEQSFIGPINKGEEGRDTTYIQLIPIIIPGYCDVVTIISDIDLYSHKI